MPELVKESLNFAVREQLTQAALPQAAEVAHQRRQRPLLAASRSARPPAPQREQGRVAKLARPAVSHTKPGAWGQAGPDSAADICGAEDVVTGTITGRIDNGLMLGQIMGDHEC